MNFLNPPKMICSIASTTLDMLQCQVQHSCDLHQAQAVITTRTVKTTMISNLKREYTLVYRNPSSEGYAAGLLCLIHFSIIFHF